MEEREGQIMPKGDKLTAKQKNPVGRPKELFKPWAGWQDDILSLYSEGGSDVEIRAMMLEKMKRKSFHFDLWDRWLKEEAQFSETIKMGKLLSEAWWMREGREGLKKDSMQETVKLNYTGWYMNMKNRFGWSDKPDVKEEEKSTSITFNFIEKTERE